MLGLLMILGIRFAQASEVVDNLVYWSGVAAVLTVVKDTFSPNWEIREARFPDNHYQLALQMKRSYSGGAGEARVVFHRRARELMRAGGFDGYQILEYSEGMESSVFGAQRNAGGVIRLTRSSY